MTGIFMAIDHARETRSTQEKIIILAAANGDTDAHLSEQNQIQFGTTRRSEILGIIGDTGQTYEKIYNDYLDSL